MSKLRLVILVLFLSSPLLAERIFLKNGTVVDGVIIQQSRTAVQVRTVDGRVLTLEKDAIRKIDYAFDPQKEAQKQAEEKKRKELAEQEKRRLEAEKKAEQDREKTAREKIAKEEQERLAKERRDAESREREKGGRENRSQNSPPWWIEPLFSIGSGRFNSGLSTFYWDNYQGTSLGNLASPTGNAEMHFETDWNYSSKGISQLALRGGFSRFIGEIDVRSYSAKVSLLDTVGGGVPGFSAIGGVNAVTMEKLEEAHSSLRAGWQFWNSDINVMAVYLGSRSLQATTSYSFIGGAEYISAGPPVSLTFFGPESDLSMKGSGPEITLEYERRFRVLPVSVKGRITAFQMNLTAKLEELAIGTAAFAGGSSSSLSWASFENSYRHQGYALSLRGDYRLSGGTQLFLELYGLRSDSTLKSVDFRSLLAADEFGVYPGEAPEVSVASLILLPAFEKKKGNAEVIQTVSFGASHRFEFR